MASTSQCRRSRATNGLTAESSMLEKTPRLFGQRADNSMPCDSRARSGAQWHRQLCLGYRNRASLHSSKSLTNRPMLIDCVPAMIPSSRSPPSAGPGLQQFLAGGLPENRTSVTETGEARRRCCARSARRAIPRAGRKGRGGERPQNHQTPKTMADQMQPGGFERIDVPARASATAVIEFERCDRQIVPVVTAIAHETMVQHEGLVARHPQAMNVDQRHAVINWPVAAS